MSTGRPAGDLATWVEQTRVAVASGDADVPCDRCTACCESFQFVHVGPDDDAARARIPDVLLFPAPGRPEGHQLMGYDERGRCPMLVDGSCSIYDDRPMTCRVFDCRVFAATGVAVDPDKPLIAERVGQWRFSGGDESLSTALRDAADFVRVHRDEPMFTAAVHSPTGHAVLAIEIHDEFLDGIDASTDEMLVRLRERHRSRI